MTRNRKYLLVSAPVILPVALALLVTAATVSRR